MVMSVKHLSVVANHTWKAVNVVSFCTWNILYTPDIYILSGVWVAGVHYAVYSGHGSPEEGTSFS